MICKKNHSDIQTIMENLPIDQGRKGRHKCAACAYAVSYTHLDVYKRQTLHLDFYFRALGNISIFMYFCLNKEYQENLLFNKRKNICKITQNLLICRRCPSLPI